jgi:hypothetical protein
MAIGLGVAAMAPAVNVSVVEDCAWTWLERATPAEYAVQIKARVDETRRVRRHRASLVRRYGRG